VTLTGGDAPPATEHHLWGGRFDGGPAQAAARLNWSLPVDLRLWPQDVRAARAWAAALGEAGVLDGAEVQLIDTGLERVAERLEAGEGGDAHDEDVHTLVERLLYEEVGPVAGKLNTGRSRNDQVATDLRLWTMDAMEALTAEVAALAQALVTQAAAGVDVLLPGYTHGQRAQPVRWSYVMLAHSWPLVRDLDRLATVRDRAAEMPLGSGAVAGTAFAVNRAALKTRLGFRRLSPNALDATGDRDFVADALFAMSMIATHASRLAGELLAYTASEYGFVRLSDAYCTGSSLLPQKRNPDVLELARGGASGVVADLTAMLSLVKGLPAGYAKDLQDDKRAVFDAMDRLTLLLPALRGAVETMEPQKERMRAALDPGLVATDIADALVLAGVPFREAHGIVGQVVRTAEAMDVGIFDVPAGTLEGLHAELPAAVAAVGDWEASIERRGSVGGASRAAIAEQLRELEMRLAPDAPRPAP
jgi:argininosuccinate lyase